MELIMETTTKTKFNWIALLINGGAYYAGYGKVKKGLLMALIGFIPLTVFCVNIYAGFKANKELPVKKQEFNWGKAIGVFLFQGLILTVSSVLIKGWISEQPQAHVEQNVSQVSSANILSDISGTWKSEYGETFIFSLAGEPKLVAVEGDVYPFEVTNIDESRGVVNLKSGTVDWKISLVEYDDNSFRLKLEDSDTINTLNFVSDEVINVMPVETQSEYKQMGLDDLQLDINSLRGEKISVTGEGLFNVDTLYLMREAGDLNMIKVKVDGLDRDSRKMILNNCEVTSACNITVSGVVGNASPHGIYEIGVVADKVEL